MTHGAGRFVERYPVVWHVIEADGAGPWLRDTGLLPTSTLLRLAGHRDDGANRGDFRRVSFGAGRCAVIRPQVMPDDRLLPTLAGRFAGKPGAWRRHVNAHVFFWTEQRRRDAFLRACQRFRGIGEPPRVLQFDTAALLHHHAASAFWSRINTGSTLRGGARARRDDDTLCPLASYRGGAVAELAVRGRVGVSELSRP